MQFTDWLTVGALALAPIAELRGALPLALAQGAPFYLAYPICVVLNALIAPLLFLFLNTAHQRLYRLNWYKKLFDRFVVRARQKLEKKVEKYGYLGVLFFVAIPLPITGAYTGSLGAWLLGLSGRRTFVAVFCGVAIAGAIVSSVYFLGLKSLSIFLKQESGV